MFRFRRAINWLRRIGHGRGFGVQSPNDYRFLRNVVNERYPYYKYDDLDKMVASKDGYSRKRCRLCFRLSNYAQPDFFLEINGKDDGLREHVLAACKKTKSVTVSPAAASLPDDWVGKTFLVRCSLAADAAPLLRRVLKGCGERSVIVVDDIATNDEMQALWSQLADAEEVTVAYDLYRFGILLKESRRYKKKYFVNF